MKGHIHGLLAGGLYIICNYIITNIPCWHIRKALYRLLGMKVGKGSRIMMKTIVTHPWKIKIGDNATINEYCYLDGRGGLSIGNNVNIALRSMLITGSHHTGSIAFDYYTEPIKIEDDVWLGSQSMVLNGCTIGHACIIGAGAVVQPRSHCEERSIYGGVPAKKIKERYLCDSLELSHWNIHFR